MNRFCILFLILVTTIHRGYSQDRLEPDGAIPILAWVGVPESETSLYRFRELKESGINIKFFLLFQYCRS